MSPMSAPQREPVPTFTEVPSGIEQVRRNVLRGVTSTQLLRVSGACRRDARAIRRQLTVGNPSPEWVPRMEDQVVDLTLMEGVLRTLAGAFREAERREEARDAFVDVARAEGTANAA